MIIMVQSIHTYKHIQFRSSKKIIYLINFLALEESKKARATNIIIVIMALFHFEYVSIHSIVR